LKSIASWLYTWPFPSRLRSSKHCTDSICINIDVTYLLYILKVEINVSFCESLIFIFYKFHQTLLNIIKWKERSQSSTSLYWGLNTFPNIDFEENNPDANQKLIKLHYMYYILLAFVEFYYIKLQNREL